MPATNSFDPAEPPARYVVGIDLGTTNSAVCRIDTQRQAWSVETFPIPQLVAPGEVEARETLPSFLYLAGAGEFAPDALKMPWDSDPVDRAVGVFAREQGKLVPGRVVESAKSWLCHPGVDRTSPLLPWHAGDGVSRLSPVEASAAYLEHIRKAWLHAHPEDPLENQDVVITLPASFDEVARELTVEAAKRAGLNRVLLIEEPQAAFYAWINAHPDNWNELVSPGQNILVCDIGGGTSDFTLIRVRSHPADAVQFHRIAVGEHLILGGDNLDLALAHHLEEQAADGKKLDARVWGTLVRLCRLAKETLLDEQAPESLSLTLPGTGTRLIGGGKRIDLRRDDARQLLLEGFFPDVPLDVRPEKQASGFREFGLPYAADPAVTKHLAAFLRDHCTAGMHLDEAGSERPDVVLFNGGVFVSPVVRDRVTDAIRQWYAREDSNWTPHILRNERHDLAVARGAAYYGMVRRGEGVRIAAGLPRSYYLGVGSTGQTEAQSSMQALCLMPAGTEPETEIALDQHTFQLTVAAPVEFPLFHSSLRLTDPAGSLVPLDREQLTPLPPIRTVLRSRDKQQKELSVQVHAQLTELGTLQIWCSDTSSRRTWQLQFDVRSATQTDVAAHTGGGEASGVLDEESIHAVREIIDETFSSGSPGKPGGLAKRIAKALDQSRDDWPPSLLRQIWQMLMDVETGRQKSADHEGRWLNLLGFSLRPGYGVALDDWRVAETWKRLRGKLHFPGTSSLAEWWILWRRISGGLPGGQQQALANPLMTTLRDQKRRSGRSAKSRSASNAHEQAESWRMLGSLERLPVRFKQELGELALEFLDDPDRESLAPALLWSLGRIGARQPLYGPLNDAISAETAAAWIDRLVTAGESSPERHLAVMQIARMTGDRYRDIPEAARHQAVHWLEKTFAPEHFVDLVQTAGDLAAGDAALVFGESVPLGLRLTSS